MCSTGGDPEKIEWYEDFRDACSEGNLNSPNSMHGLKERILAGGEDGETATAIFAEWKTNMRVCLL
jgi:hypothetical protein